MYKYVLKRLFDLVSSLLAIILLALPMLIIAIIIKIDSPGPVFFKQKRVGIHKKLFTILKFRSMPTNVPKDLRNSLLSRFNAGEPVVPDSIFFDMYSKAYEAYDLTGGVVDAASGPLFDLWGFGFKSGEFPDEVRVGKARKCSGMNRLRRDMRTVLSEDGTLAPSALLEDSASSLPVLNYNAIAQGYSCDLVAAYLYSLGVKDMMVDIGEIYCDGRNPSGRPWTIGIDKPSDGNNERGAEIQAIFSVPEGPHGVVTSGNYRKFYVRDGKKYAHTVDPRTGFPVSHNLLSATIVAGDATTADAYATYCMVMGLEASKSFIESSPDLEGCLVYDDGGEFRTWCSTGFTLKEL